MHQMRISTTHAHVEKVGKPKKKVKTEKVWWNLFYRSIQLQNILFQEGTYRTKREKSASLIWALTDSALPKFLPKYLKLTRWNHRMAFIQYKILFSQVFRQANSPLDHFLGGS
jgi:hypothetical protein